AIFSCLGMPDFSTSSCWTRVSSFSRYQKYRTFTMPGSEPRSTLAVTVCPDFNVLFSSGSTILKAHVGEAIATCKATAVAMAPGTPMSLVMVVLLISSFEVERDIGQDDAFLQQQSPLIVQDILPPPRRQDLRDHDGDPPFGIFLQQFLDVVQQRLENRTVR